MSGAEEIGALAMLSASLSKEDPTAFWVLILTSIVRWFATLTFWTLVCAGALSTIGQSLWFVFPSALLVAALWTWVLRPRDRRRMIKAMDGALEARRAADAPDEATIPLNTDTERAAEAFGLMREWCGPDRSCALQAVDAGFGPEWTAEIASGPEGSMARHSDPVMAALMCVTAAHGFMDRALEVIERQNDIIDMVYETINGAEDRERLDYMIVHSPRTKEEYPDVFRAAAAHRARAADTVETDGDTP